jgi:hypothetical protein
MGHQDDESAHEADGRPGDTPEQAQPQPPAPPQPQASGPGWGPYQPAGPQPGQQPYPPYYQQPWGQQQWYPGMPFPPYAAPRRGPGRAVQGVIVGVGALMIALIVFGAVTIMAHANQSARVAASGSNSNQSNEDAPVPMPPTGTQTTQVGRAMTLAGLSAGEQVSVTVTKVYNYAQPADQYNEPTAGEKLFAVALRFKNTGSSEYSDSPGNSVTIYDSNGGSYQTDFYDAIECSSFQPTINVQVGSSSVGCVVFDVPNDAKITKVQVILDSGYGPQTGEWKIGSLYR